jgi:hypothetical protein
LRVCRAGADACGLSVGNPDARRADPGHQRDWHIAAAESQRLADEFAQMVASSRRIDAQPLV